jgi:hypothetical protein
MIKQNGILREGVRRVWKRQRILWWFFVVNLVLAWVATAPYSARLSEVTAHSLYSESLINGFDYGAYSELVSNPDVAHDARLPESGVGVLVYFFFALFLTGGVLEAYASDRKLTTSEFFQACGAFFWRGFRLLILVSVVLTPIALLAGVLIRWSGRLMLNTVNERTGYWVGLGVFVLTTLLAMMVRLWFDLAQVRTVIDDQRGMIRTTVQSLKFTLSNFWSLFWLYFRISALAWIGLAVGLWIWTHIPGQHSGLSFWMMEIVLLWWIGTRLWQRASETVWYLHYSMPEITEPIPSVQSSLPVGLTTTTPTN